MAITIGFNHVATGTPDLDRLIRFYADAFDATVVHEIAASPPPDFHPRMAIIDLGGGAALNVAEVPADSIIGERRSIGARGAIDHYGLAVDSYTTLAALSDRIVAAGGEVGDIQELGNEWSLFFRDCDGMELEVCAPADVPSAVAT